MRVITGSARGKRLETLEGLDVRPTTDRVKEGIFSSIQFDVPGAFVLDLFAGSGQLGIESLSRGARKCVFVDQSRQSQEVVKKNLLTTGLSKQARVVAMDYSSFLKTNWDRFDIAFLDPPYHRCLLQSAVEKLIPHMSDSGIIVCESEKNEWAPENLGKFGIYRKYYYGKIEVTILKIPENA